MTSKYDAYWRSKLDDIAAMIDSAVDGGVARLSVDDIRQYGQRNSWYGLAVVSERRLVSAQMAHATSLGRVVAASGVTAKWPGEVFRLMISPACVLWISLDSVPSRSKEAQDRSPAKLDVPSVVTDPEPFAADLPLDAADACRRLHELLGDLPYFSAPDGVGFSNGLYFFYELGEQSEHGPDGRIVRVGNHPQAQDRLKGRLRDHYRTGRDAKNGSVFRRYLGGALLRRENDRHPCLEPGPGLGHWEHGAQIECDACAPIEPAVTDYLDTRMKFRVVRVDDRETRNTLEKALIGTVARCPECQPSSDWLGQVCYQREVQESGMWNQRHTSDPPASERQLAVLESSIRLGRVALETASATTQRHDLSDTLLVIPCCSSKQGAATGPLPLRRVVDFLPERMATLLEAGRHEAFDRKGVALDRRSPLTPALQLYSGQPFATAGFRDALVAALDRGLHCLIASGGYGLVRPEEPIHSYAAHVPTQTRSVWARRLRAAALLCRV